MSFRRLPLALLVFCSAALADPEIKLKGVEGQLADNVLHHIGSISDNEFEHPRLLRQKLKNDIPQAMRALGYFESHFEFSREKNSVTIDIDLGPAVAWAEPQIHIDGGAADLRPVRKLLDNQPFKVGATINQQTYENYKRDLLELCQEYGFLDARFEESRLRIDLEQHRATAILSIVAGKRYRVTAQSFSGSKLDQELLMRLSPVRTDSYYRKTDVTDLQRNLQSSGYFRDIDVQTEKLDDETIAIAAKLADAPSHQISVGAGYGTDTGPRTKLRWEQPHVTREGHKLITELSVSQPQQDLSVEYRIPLQKPLDDSLNLTTAWEHKAVEDTSSTVGSVGFFISRRRADTWILNYGVTYDDENYRQGNEPRRRVQYALPGANITEVVLGPGIDPLWGRKTWAAATMSAPVIGADTSFIRINAGYKRLIDIGHKQLLIPRIELGVVTTDDIQKIPSSQRFFTGGDQTVRGYDFESLGSRDADGNLIGGRYLNVASLEYSFKILEQWRLAVFSDTGRAFNHWGEPWHYSAGFGVRWLSPVGQIRVDLAFPVNEEDRSWRLHIFMGPPL